MRRHIHSSQITFPESCDIPVAGFFVPTDGVDAKSGVMMQKQSGTTHIVPDLHKNSKYTPLGILALLPMPRIPVRSVWRKSTVESECYTDFDFESVGVRVLGVNARNVEPSDAQTDAGIPVQPDFRIAVAALGGVIDTHSRIQKRRNAPFEGIRAEIEKSVQHVGGVAFERGVVISVATSRVVRLFYLQIGNHLISQSQTEEKPVCNQRTVRGGDVQTVLRTVLAAENESRIDHSHVTAFALPARLLGYRVGYRDGIAGLPRQMRRLRTHVVGNPYRAVFGGLAQRIDCLDVLDGCRAECLVFGRITAHRQGIVRGERLDSAVYRHFRLYQNVGVRAFENLCDSLLRLLLDADATLEREHTVRPLEHVGLFALVGDVEFHDGRHLRDFARNVGCPCRPRFGNGAR